MRPLKTAWRPDPKVEHPPSRTRRSLRHDERRPSGLLADAASAGGLSATGTTAVPSPEPGGGDSWPAEATPRNPSGKGRHYANGGQLADRCQVSTVAVSRPLFRWVIYTIMVCEYSSGLDYTLQR